MDENIQKQGELKIYRKRERKKNTQTHGDMKI